MYCLVWILINLLMSLLGGFDFKTPFFWIVQALFAIGLFLKKDD